MAQPTQIVFSHKEVIEALLRKQGIHSGIWGMYIRFGLKGANFGTSPEDVLPTAIVPILEIGVQRFEEESNIAVDAAKVNPKQGQPKKTRSTHRRAASRKTA